VFRPRAAAAVVVVAVFHRLGGVQMRSGDGSHHGPTRHKGRVVGRLGGQTTAVTSITSQLTVNYDRGGTSRYS
jgi:hypothetical protein